VGVTVANFDRFVQWYADIFGARLVGVGSSPSDRVRSFFGVDAPQPECRIGWLRLPGGGILEIFEFIPHQDPAVIPWNRVGLTHIGIDVVNTYKWHDYLVSKGVEIVSKPERSPRAHTFFFAKDCDGNLIELIDLQLKYRPLQWGGALAGWLFKRGMYRKHYEPPVRA
jgi:catechol 2,3-dioxygenase-like lactoylglutathione lyase family enzyme